MRTEWNTEARSLG